MQLAKTSISGLLLALATISGCASTGESPAVDHRSEILARWSQCVDQRAKDYDGAPHKALNYVFNRCDGHKRDVLASYPRHLENRLDQMLKDKTRARTLTYLVETTFGEQTGLKAATLNETGHNEL